MNELPDELVKLLLAHPEVFTPEDMVRLDEMLLGVCTHCKAAGSLRRMNTAYANQASNWACLCDGCFERMESYWAEQWREYNSEIYAGLRTADGSWRMRNR